MENWNEVEVNNFSKITFGTMRLHQSHNNESDALLFLIKLYENGITSYHSSMEYEGYDLFCKTLSKFKSKIGSNIQMQHICKLSSPNFNEKKFSLINLEKQIDNELINLKIEKIDVVQWLFRYSPIEDNIRISRTKEQLTEIKLAFEKLISKGKIVTFSSFPYSVKYAQFLIDNDLCKNFTNYFSLLETEYLPIVEQSKAYFSIRPLAAGKLTYQYFDQNNKLEILKNFLEEINLTGISIENLSLIFSLFDKKVTSLIMSLKNEHHISSSISALNAADSNLINYQYIAAKAQLILPKFSKL